MAKLIFWNVLGLEQKILEILDVQPYAGNKHHFGRPFLTSYQIAIELKKKYNKAFKQIDKPLGGVKSGQFDSVAKYIANQLSIKISKDKNYKIEGRFLSMQHKMSLCCKCDGKKIRSCQETDLSIFRLKS